ncbi:ImmA/IrrE family metallo-endopeptidase [Micromonospora sp. AMSO12t]|uniref:helix-turn-helix domain-containing protein n=1 Tax=Micromonospora sp. AMSO12t TaxID=2650410 RepID=UPI00124AFABE|nr:ImmA/IrrE family metallo-endopeptidase [Micromonospora sp. AMSO12t]KAB1141591.1 ImmA/IrrE family metallo-endopeptidase [Micromonospora sp. AMSO12t]
MVTPSRLVLARKRRRMTLAALSTASGISVRSLTAYENGHKAPAADTSYALASALQVPLSFLQGSTLEEIPIDAVSFRALSKMTALDRGAALSAGRIAMLINDWIEKRFRLPEANLPTFPHLGPEEAAERVRAFWGLGESPIPNMVHLLEANGVRVFSLAHDCQDVDAFSFKHKGRPFVFLNTSKSGERGRFDAAHELGHLVMHSEHRVPNGMQAEEEAQAFASALLMPRADLLAHSVYDMTPNQILVAKRRWKVAALALTYRLHEIGMLSDWKYRTAAKRLSQLGYRRSEPGGIARESSQVLTKVFRLMVRDVGGWRPLLDELQLTREELNRHVFGLVPVAVEGGGQRSFDRPTLQLVRGTK